MASIRETLERQRKKFEAEQLRKSGQRQVVTPQGVPVGPRNEGPAARRARISGEAKEFRESQPDYNPPGTKLGRAIAAIGSADRDITGRVASAFSGRGGRDPSVSAEEGARLSPAEFAEAQSGRNDPGTKLSRAIAAIGSADREQTGIMLENLGLLKSEGVLPLAGHGVKQVVTGLAKGGEAAIDVIGGPGTTDKFSSGIANKIAPKAGVSPLAEAIVDKPAAEVAPEDSFIEDPRLSAQGRALVAGGQNIYEGAASNTVSQAGKEFLARGREEQGRPQSAVRRERATRAIQEEQVKQQAKTNKALEGGKVKEVNKSFGEEAGLSVASIMSQNGVEEDFAEGKNLVKRTQGQVSNFVKRSDNPEQAMKDVNESWTAMTNSGIPQSIIAKYFTQWSRALGDDTAEEAVANKMKNEAAKLAAKPKK